MGLARAWSVALVGLQGDVIEVQADIAEGLPKTTLIGLPDASLSEARDRVRAAIANSAARFPMQRITVGLSPATLPKAGSHYDVAIAVAILAATNRVPADALADQVLIGELGLDGRVRDVRGVLSMTLAAANAGFSAVIVPERNATEAMLVPGISVLGVRSLRQVLAILTGDPIPDEPEPQVEWDADRPLVVPTAPNLDLHDIAGQPDARLAVEVAAAGGHHLYLHGPPGAGKTMLAERLPGLLPDLDTDAALEVSAVHSLAGLLAGSGRQAGSGQLVSRPPFVAPHHTATLPSLAGGGSGLPKPGAISCAHRGVLFIDEAAEMHPATLDSLRQPLESGFIEVHRSGAVARFPARFLLVLAANPCPCGNASTPGGECECPPMSVRRYASRISGPIRDRIDITRPVLPMSAPQFSRTLATAESSDKVAQRVAAARDRQRRRFAEDPWELNAQLPGPQVRDRLPLSRSAAGVLESCYAQNRITIRGVDRVIRLAWTLADLAGSPEPDPDQVHFAYRLRTGQPLIAAEQQRDLRATTSRAAAG